MSWALSGLAFLLVGAGVAALTEAVDEPLDAEVLGGNTPVNPPRAGAGDAVAHHAPTVALDTVDETNLAVASHVESPSPACAVYVSEDGGSTWQPTPVPTRGPPGAECHAPDAAFGADGSLHVLYATRRREGDDAVTALRLVSSDDGGRSFSDPRRVGGGRALQPRLAADREAPGRLYATWVAGAQDAEDGSDGGPRVRAAVTDDGGQSWSDPVRVSDPSHGPAAAPSPAVGDGGGVYVAYLRLDEGRSDAPGPDAGAGSGSEGRGGQLVLARSDDGGATWSRTPVDRVAATGRRGTPLPASPSVAAGRDGTVHVASHDGRRGQDADVWLWTSPDEGRTWRERVRVNAGDDGTHQYLPEVAVAPTGRVDVVYYDRRADADNQANEVTLQSSVDGGETFTDRVVVSDRAFAAPDPLDGEGQTPAAGERLGLVSTEAHGLAVWPDTRASAAAAGRQDLARALVAFSGGSALPAAGTTALRLASVGFALVGLGLFVAWGLGRRRGPPAPPGPEAVPPGDAAVPQEETAPSVVVR